MGKGRNRAASSASMPKALSTFMKWMPAVALTEIFPGCRIIDIHEY